MTNSELWHNLNMALAKRRPPRGPVFWSPDLPNPANYPAFRTITMPREQLERFRADFAELVAFVCAITGRPFEKLCGLDLLDLTREFAGREWAKENETRHLLGREAVRLLDVLLAETNAAPDQAPPAQK